MAIIYTYPKLTNPLGNELIVVSDVNNKNATRLITIASIASLVPGGDGCGASIVKITDADGADIYTPPACSPMILTSSDNSIGITGIAGGVDLTTSCSWNLQKWPPSGDPAPPIYNIGCDGFVFLEDTCSISSTINTIGTTPRIALDLNYGPYGDEGGSDFIGCATAGTPDCDSEIIFRKLTGGTYEVQRAEISDLASCFGSGSVDCAETDTIGGIKVGSIVEDAEPAILPVDESNVYLAVQRNSACEAFVTMNFNILPCAGLTTRGGITALQNGTLTTRPDAADSGAYYPIEIVDSETVDCAAVVRVPSVSSCASPTTVGGIKANIVELESVPEPADEGAYYPVEIIENESPSAADCFAVVKVPSSGGATPGDGQITITAGTGLTGGGSFTVNQAADTIITLNADGVAESGWSPFPITQGGTTLGTQASAFTVFYHATADATFGINSIKMMLTDTVPGGGPNKDDDFSVALYEGSLTDIENGGDIPTLIGAWDYTAGGAPVFGVKKVYKAAVTNVVAGNDYIIAVSVNANGALLLGDGGVNTGTGSDWFSNNYLCQGNNNLYNSGGTGGAAEWPIDLVDSELDFANPWKYCIHFFAGGAPDDIVGEEEGEEEG